MAELEQELEEYITQQFEAFQLSSNGGTSSVSAAADASSKAASIQRHVQILALNHGVTQLTLTGKNADKSGDTEGIVEDQDLAALLLPFLRRYVDAALTMDVVSTEQKEAVSRVFDLVAALACTISVTCQHAAAIDTVLTRAHEFSDVLLERLRSQACALLSVMAVQLGGVLRRSNKLLPNLDQRQAFETTIASCMDAMETTLLPRLTDKSQSVRQSAIQAAGSLLSASALVTSKTTTKVIETNQKNRSKAMNDDSDDDDQTDSEDEDSGSEEGRDNDAEDTENLALNGLIWSMWHDPSVANRVEAIQAVPITPDTVDHIVARIRDVKEKVRVAALDVLRLKVDPREDMHEEHFCDILQHGLTERCESTKAATVKLICTKWIKVAKFDPVELVRIMGVTINDEECEKALKVVLKTVRSGNFSPLQELSDPEIRSFCANIDKSMVHLKDSGVVFDEFQLFYTRVACSTAKESTDLSYTQKEDVLSKAAPDIPTLCDLFQKHLVRFMESIQEEDQESEDQESFVCLQLLQLAKVAGLQEEGSRRHFANVMAKTLSTINTPEELVEECVESLRAAHEEDEIEFFNAVSVILATLMSQQEQDENLVMDDEKISETTTRVLLMFSVVLEKASSTLASHDLQDNMVKIVLSAVSSSTRSIRELGVSCFGKLGLLSREKTVLTEFKPILLKIACNEGEALQCRGQALLALADWAMLYTEVLEEHEFGDKSTLKMMECLHTMMGHGNESIVAIASEVAAKMLFSDRVKDQTLMGRLLAVFLDPNLQKDRDDEDMDAEDKSVGSPLRLQQLLSLFFPAFCLKSSGNRSFLLGSIKDSLVIASSMTKTKKRPLVFPLVKIVEYVCSIVSQSDTANDEKTDGETKKGHDVSLSSCVQVARFLVKQEEKLSVTQRRALCKFLGGQDIDTTTSDKKALLILKACMEELVFVADTSSAKSLRPMTELMHDVNGEIEEENMGSTGEDEVAASDDSDDDTITEHSNQQNEDIDDDSTGGSTVTDGLIDTLATLSMTAKENPPKSTKSAKTSRRSSTQSNTSILESLGSPNNA